MKKIISISFLFLAIVCLFASSAETKLAHSPLITVADLSVTKVDSPDPVNTGADLTYTITVTNNGPDAATNASWSDTLPAGTTFTAMPDVSGWSCTTPDPGATGTVSCSNPSFAVGNAVFTLVVTVAPTVPAGSVLSNTATTTSSTADSNSGNNSSTATTTVLSPANVTGNKSVSGGTTPGSTLSYLVILSNSSASDQQNNPGDEFTDVLPSGLTLVSADASSGTATPTIGTNTVTWNGVVPAQDSVTITITATINTGTDGQTISNQGTVHSDADGNGTNETNTPTNSASFTVGAATANADLGVVKVASADTSPADSDVTYTITVTNGGPDTATNATLTDTLPGTMTFVSLSQPAGWSCNSLTPGSGGTLTCSRDLPVASGAQVFTLVGHIPSGTPDGTNYPNNASVSTTSSDPTSENNSSTAGTNVGCLANPVVTTNADSGPGSLRRAIQDACTGGTITFDMTTGHVLNPITLTSAELLINKDLTIAGPGANILTVQRSTAIGTPIFRIFDTLSATVTISGLTITNGNTPDGASGGNNPGVNGGGIYNTGTLTITNSTISGNLTGSGGSNSGGTGGSGGAGGGIFSSGTLTITNSTISGNQAAQGGNGGSGGTGGTGGSGAGIANTGTLTITNSTISGNQAGNGGNAGSTGAGGNGGDGGGILSDTGTITNCTVSGNQAGNGGMAGDNGAASSGRGGGLYKGAVGPVVDIRNSIIAGNSSPTGPDINGTVNSQDYNLIGTISGATITGTTTHNITNTSANLGALANNGGPTQTMLPLPGSPAIDAGDPANLPPDTFDLDGDSDTAEALPVDQRGFARVVGTNFDIGAVETNYVFSATAGTPQSAVINTAFGTALKATLTESGNAQNGISATFTAPASGPSGTFPGPSATAVVSTNSSGDATAPTFTANGTTGTYSVVASIGTGLPTASFTLTNTKVTQIITFNPNPLPNKTFGDPDFTVSATASSGLTVSFSAIGQCTVSGTGTVHLTGAGSCTITASQSGNSSFDVAPDVPRPFTINKTNQTITFGALANKNLGDPDFSVSASATSGLAVAFTASGSCTVTGSTVHITSAGSCTITAKQAGDSNYNAATDVPQSFSIANRPLVSLSQGTYSVNESAGFVTITVNRTGDLSVPVTVDYATSDNSGPTSGPCVNGTGQASSRCDFTSVFGTLKFAATETQKTFIVPITLDSFTEGPEIFTVTLSNLTGTGAAFATPSNATVTINDGTTTLPGNAIDDTDAFVRTQYHDFLNREADAPGLAFWKNNIDQCKAPGGAAGFASVAQCIEVMRINTSAAFFLSIEFKQTGGMVRDFYVAALNRPATNNMPNFVEFERDTQAVQRGVIVDPNNNAWQTVLNANRLAFMNDFVMRAEFVGLYPTTDTPSIYIGKLYQHALGRTPTAAELADATSGFGSAATAADPTARGQALLKVTQATDFQTRELNRSFVQMEYFGYLRRNPNDAPDTDFSGYNFWLTKLNQFNGNFIQAEMVKAFLSSAEYRHRFGP